MRTEDILGYKVVFEPVEEGGFVVSVPALSGCFTQGDTLEEARCYAHGAIVGFIAMLQNIGMPVPVEEKTVAYARN